MPRAPAAGSARITHRDPEGTSASLPRIPCRIWRATRCRTTEPPTDLLTVTPKRAGSSPPSKALCTTTVGSQTAGGPDGPPEILRIREPVGFG